jgi:hypothetical protein
MLALLISLLWWPLLCIASPPYEQRFLVVGDWGTSDDSKVIAPLLSELTTNTQAMWMLGDNFYTPADIGVSSSSDPSFKKIYEDPFKLFPPDFEFAVIPGNHDYDGQIQAQLDYHDPARRWYFPALLVAFFWCGL